LPADALFRAVLRARLEDVFLAVFRPPVARLAAPFRLTVFRAVDRVRLLPLRVAVFRPDDRAAFRLAIALSPLQGNLASGAGVSGAGSGLAHLDSFR
jgi:hypothetical protein